MSLVKGEYGSLVISRPEEPLPNRQHEKAARSEAFIELLRAGLETHPAFAAVDRHELWHALDSARELQTA